MAQGSQRDNHRDHKDAAPRASDERRRTVAPVDGERRILRTPKGYSIYL